MIKVNHIRFFLCLIVCVGLFQEPLNSQGRGGITQLSNILNLEQPSPQTLSTVPRQSPAPPSYNRYMFKVNKPLLSLRDASNFYRDSIELVNDTVLYRLNNLVSSDRIKEDYYLGLTDYALYLGQNNTNQYWQTKQVQYNNNPLEILGLGGFTFGGTGSGFLGENAISIVGQGSVDLLIGFKTTRNDNPLLSDDLKRSFNFELSPKIQASLTGKVGDQVELKLSYNTEATFDYENLRQLEYTGKEDDLLKKLQLGTVSLPVNSSLVSGAFNLTGVRSDLQFGDLDVSLVASLQQNGETKVINVDQGAQSRTFEIKASDYDADKHYFLSKEFRDNFESAMSSLPTIRSPYQINRVEVWITNKSRTTQNTRNILGIEALDENNTGDNWDNLPASWSNGSDYQYLDNARKLLPSQYTVHEALGYISLNSPLRNNEVLSVSFEYYDRGVLKKVGEFELDKPKSTGHLITKLLRGQNFSPSAPTWDYMLRNIYSLNTYNVSKENFQLNVLYHDQTQTNYINFLPEGPEKGKPLIQVLGTDKLNIQQEVGADGVFDFVPNATMITERGWVVFPSLRPFDDGIKKTYGTAMEQYAYPELYDSIKVVATQSSKENLYVLRGEYQSTSSSDIPLNTFNVAPGSVEVTAGGVKLTEGVDYSVDYTIGRVKILDPSLLDSRTPIKVSLQSQEAFSSVQRSFFGAVLNYHVNKNLTVKGLGMYLTETPNTEKVNYQQEAVANALWGVGVNYQSELDFLTTMANYLPFYNSTQTSTIEVSGELLQLLPSTSSTINNGVFIDDFDVSQGQFTLSAISPWTLSSSPEINKSGLDAGYKRAKLAWYAIDFDFLTDERPASISIDEASEDDVRYITINEIYPDRELIDGENRLVNMLNLSYYPEEKGPYNFSLDVTSDGDLKNPDENWGGIMRKIEVTNFETANVTEISFWLMEPITDNFSTNGGAIYLDVGNLSEDILSDGHKSYENGLGIGGEIDTSEWGIAGTQNVSNYILSNDAALRAQQDVGLDGLNDVQEAQFFSTYLSQIRNIVTNSARLAAIEEDPSGDNFRHFRNSYYNNLSSSITERYKEFNGLEGNSPISSTEGGTAYPDAEDINQDYTMDLGSGFYRYKVLVEENQTVGSNFLTQIREVNAELPNNESRLVKWYQYKIPIQSFKEKLGNIDNFQTIQFIRLWVSGFNKPVLLRIADLGLQTSTWRMPVAAITENTTPASGTIQTTAVSLETDKNRSPVNYVMPPGVDREIDPSYTNNLRELNEGAIEIKVSNLEEQNLKGVYKELGSYDMRHYNTMTMHTHAERVLGGSNLQDNDISFVIRIGSDLNNNYYEYESSLILTPPGVYNNNVALDRKAVWKDENIITIPLDALTELKLERNRQLTVPGTNISYNRPYQAIADGTQNNLVRIKGNPTLGEIKVIFIGVKNRDTENHDATVWVNELKLSNFKNEGGWAGTSTLALKVADLADVKASGTFINSGFGDVNQKVLERSFEDKSLYNISVGTDFGKLLPEKARLSIPFYINYGEDKATPKFNPLNSDITMDKQLQSSSEAEGDSILSLVQDYTQRKGYSLNNIRVTPKPDKKVELPWDLPNFSAGYSFSQLYMRDENTEKHYDQTFKWNINYDYTSPLKPIEPFKKEKSSETRKKQDWSAFITDFNINPLPSSYTFSVVGNRKYREEQRRNLNNQFFIVSPTYQKDYSLTTNYGIQWALTKSISLSYSVNGYANVFQPTGSYRSGLIGFEAKRDSVRADLLQFGKLRNYTQDFSGTYNVPLYKIKALSWTSLTGTYNTKYQWERSSVLLDQVSQGNNISNQRQYNINSALNFQRLYTLLKIAPKPKRKFNPSRNIQKEEEVTYQETRDIKNGKKIKVKHELGTNKNLQVFVINSQNDTTKVTPISSNEKRVKFKVRRDVAPAQIVVVALKKTTAIPEQKTEFLKHLLTSFKQLRVQYSVTEGTQLPGFLPNVNYGGWSYYQNQSFSAPGFGFAFGNQSRGYGRYAERNGWLTTDTILNTTYKMNLQENLTLRGEFKITTALSVTLNAKRQYSENFQELYNATTGWNTPRNQGSLSISTISLGSSFQSIGGTSATSSKLFDAFTKNRSVVQSRLGKDGHSMNSQQVAIPSFIAAYKGASANDVSLSTISGYGEIRPNWDITYSPNVASTFLGEYITSLSIGSKYVSTFEIRDFTSNPNAGERSTNGDIIPQYNINQIAITEQFSPISSISILWKNKLQTTINYNNVRNATLQINSQELAENYRREYVFTARYRLDNVGNFSLNLGLGGRKTTAKHQHALTFTNTLNIRLDKNIIQDYGQGFTQVSSGMRNISYLFNADYSLARELSVSCFYSLSDNTPYVNTSYHNITHSFGFKLRLLFSTQ